MPASPDTIGRTAAAWLARAGYRYHSPRGLTIDRQGQALAAPEAAALFLDAIERTGDIDTRTLTRSEIRQLLVAVRAHLPRATAQEVLLPAKAPQSGHQTPLSGNWDAYPGEHRVTDLWEVWCARHPDVLPPTRKALKATLDPRRVYMHRSCQLYHVPGADDAVRDWAQALPPGSYTLAALWARWTAEHPQDTPEQRLRCAVASRPRFYAAARAVLPLTREAGREVYRNN